MVNIQWEHYTPYGIGFDETFSRLEALAGGGSNYPPYNVINGDDGETILEVAVAGFAAEDLEVETERNVLTIRGKRSDDKKVKYAHKGISNKAFERNWQLADNVEVVDVKYDNGLMVVTLKKELPEKMKKRKWF